MKLTQNLLTELQRTPPTTPPPIGPLLCYPSECAANNESAYASMTSSPTASVESNTSPPNYTEMVEKQPVSNGELSEDSTGRRANIQSETGKDIDSTSCKSSGSSAAEIATLSTVNTPMDNVSLNSADSPLSTRRFETANKSNRKDSAAASYAGVGGGVLAEDSVYSPSRVGFELLKKLESANRCLEADGRAKQSLSLHHRGNHINTTTSASASSSLCASGHPSSATSGASLISRKIASVTSARGHSRNGSLTSSKSWCSVDLETAPIDDIWAIWGKIVHDWDTFHKNNPEQLRDLIRRGIPEHFRGIVWPLLCNSGDQSAIYAECLKKKSAYEKVIRRDVTRTYPDVEKFQSEDGQQAIYNVMKAYSVHDAEVGYCQGCCFLTGLLLMQMPEEQAFSVLNSIMYTYKLRDLFKPSMARLSLCLYQLNALLYDEVPFLMKHFEAQDFNLSMFASQWFLTLFTTSLSLSMSTRVFDIFLVEGLEIVFKISIAVVKICQDELLGLDMEGIINYMQKRLVPKVEVDPQKLFDTAFELKYSEKKMQTLEKEYTTLKCKDQEGQIELRRLRTENRLLQQRIDNMEKEMVTLADRLVHDQVRVAKAQEEIGSLKNEMCKSEDTYKTMGESLRSSQMECEQLRKYQAKAPSIEHMESAEQLAVDLQKELIDARSREVDAESTISELHSRITELENAQSEVHKEPSAEIAELQEQLVACKLRDAEANLCSKELRQQLVTLQRQWEKYERRFGDGAVAAPAAGTAHRLAADVMAMRVHEANVCADLHDSKRRVLELETQNHIYSRQILRLDTDKERLNEQLETADSTLNSSRNDLEMSLRSLDDLQNKIKEDSMLTAISSAEHSQNVAEMRRRIAELEIENQELETSNKLHTKKRPTSSSPRLHSHSSTPDRRFRRSFDSSAAADTDCINDLSAIRSSCCSYDSDSCCESDLDDLLDIDAAPRLSVDSSASRSGAEALDAGNDSDADVMAAIAEGLLSFDDNVDDDDEPEEEELEHRQEGDIKGDLNDDREEDRREGSDGLSDLETTATDDKHATTTDSGISA